MKRFKKIMKLAGFIVLMVLASVGIGLTGAAPIMPKNRDRLTDTKVKTELVEAKEDSLETVQPGQAKN
jgi:hypothetical protein